MKTTRILFGFWHGIGDLILATPSFRQYQAIHPDTKMSIAVSKSLLSSGLLDFCPYFEHKLEIPSVWESGIESIEEAIEPYKTTYGFDAIKLIHQSPYYRYGIHKIERTAREMGVYPLKNTETEIFLDLKHEQEALQWLKENNLIQNKYIFLNRKSAFFEKELPKEMAMNFIQKKFPELPVVEPCVSFPLQHINFTFAILKHAAKVVVVDSAMMHAADALKKPIDFAYFAIRPGIVDEVKPRNVTCNCVESDTIKKWHLKLRKKIGMQCRWLLNQCLSH